MQAQAETRAAAPATENAVTPEVAAEASQGQASAGQSAELQGARAAPAPSAAADTTQWTPISGSLAEIIAAGGKLEQGQSGPAVTEMQQLLGMSGGGLSGKFGPTTRQILEQFQRDSGIEVSGAYGATTHTALSHIVKRQGSTNRQRSGSQWVNFFPTSRAVDDLSSPFREQTAAFLAAIQAAGAEVDIAATLRPPERAYLMHYAFRIAQEGLSPAEVPAQEGVLIDWQHDTVAESRRAAQAMVDGYGIAYRPSLTSNHIEGLAIDMDISWSGTLNVVTPDGETVKIGSPRSGVSNRTLHRVAESFGVYKMLEDEPHWSYNGR